MGGLLVYCTHLNVNIQLGQNKYSLLSARHSTENAARTGYTG